MDGRGHIHPGQRLGQLPPLGVAKHKDADGAARIVGHRPRSKHGRVGTGDGLPTGHPGLEIGEVGAQDRGLQGIESTICADRAPHLLMQVGTVVIMRR